MEIKKLQGKIIDAIVKHKYAVAVLLLGLCLLLIPAKRSEKQTTDTIPTVGVEQQVITNESVAVILQSVAGAGKVKVLLSTATGEETIYQTDTEISSSNDSSNQSVKTVVLTDSQRNESGLIRQTNPVSYKGAIVVCEGADKPAVKLALTEAISKITGLGTDAICVLKMQ